MRITGTTQLLGILGNPVKHSLSPLMQNAAIAELGLDFVYIPLPVQGENLAQAIAGFETIGLVGFNITIPHKQAVLPFLSQVSEVAQAVGAVNTMWRLPAEAGLGAGAGWAGTNTDVEGFLAPLQALDRDWSETVAVVLGNGGAARAVVAGCALLGCQEIHVVGRDQAKLAAFAASGFGPLAGSATGLPTLTHRLRVASWTTLTDLLPQTGLLVNTTPLGMAPQVEACPLTPEQIALLAPGTIAYDLIYVPNPTRFLQLAQDQGAIALDGLEMLVQQGAAALRIWTGQEQVPVATMRRVLQGHLGL